MSEEFLIQPKFGPFLRLFLHSPLFYTPQFLTQSFANQTVIVTGANVGLGLEAARHFYRLNFKHRNAVDAIEVWALDLTSTALTVAFAERVNKELPRVDVPVQNAGINSKTYAVSKGTEQTMHVNVINTFLLALLLLPKLTEIAKFAKSPTTTSNDYNFRGSSPNQVSTNQCPRYI
ncbi:Short chain dehydrogenase [Lachnellula willkommii]|uniref:Short chain dehydrogenase n=1 Tax=Lachnellula willkommii TaxID=215461 RepID=A0A559MI85_9HELO|nr:Short chain dehydrogenase [Lachnellula willkommii]